MARVSRASCDGADQGFKVGWRAFAKISAVEGIHLIPEMIRDFEDFERRGISAEARRDVIQRKYGTPSL